MSLGKKFDKGKLRYDLVPVEVHEALAELMTYGTTKYNDENWKYVEDSKYEAALFRHLNEWRKGVKKDPESGFSHLKHALTNLSFLVYKESVYEKWTTKQHIVDEIFEDHDKNLKSINGGNNE